MVLNFSLREEIQISGVLIWKSINELNKIKFNNEMKGNYLVEYPFLTLYTASQGIKRIQKIIIELICKKEHIKEVEKKRMYKLLMSHAHNALNDWIENKTNIRINANCKKLIDIFYRFYDQGRYLRYADEKYSVTSTYEYNLLLELKTNGEEDIDYNIKNNFGKYLGKLTHTYYAIVCKLCHELTIYAYEIEYASSALIVYNHREQPKNLYTELLFRIELKKRYYIGW